MKKLLMLILISLNLLSVYGQVGISKDNSFNPDNRTQFHIKQDNEVVRLPRVNNTNALPTSGFGTTDDGTEGSIIYNKETGSIVQNDGTKWNISDVIVTTRKNGKTARFVRSGDATLDFGNCGLTGLSCSGNKVIDAGVHFYNFTNNINNEAYNDIPSDVSLVSTINPQIRFNSKGLYRISFKSGMATEQLPTACVGITTNYYSRVDLQKSTNNGSTWNPIASNTSNKQIPGALSANDLSAMVSAILSLNNTGLANSITYTGVFNSNELIRINYYGNLNMGTATCSTSILLQPINMNLKFNGTGANMSEIIIEKISF